VLSSEDIVHWFLTHGADPNAWCSHACTGTTEAARSASLSVLKLLVSHGGSVVSTDAVAQAVSGHVLGFPGRLEVMEYILDNGAPIDAYRFAYSGAEAPSLIDLFGLETGLQLAARGGKTDMVELLLKRGADKTLKGGFRTKGETAMEIAIASGFTDIVTLLK